MKPIGEAALKLAGIPLVYWCWLFVAGRAFSFGTSLALTWGGVLVVPFVALAGRDWLNRKPTARRAQVLTVPVHYLEALLLGCALIVSYRFMQVHPIVRVPISQRISLPLMQVLSLLALVAVLNLAIRGLGLPFAAILSSKLATSWLYAHSRNPMLLSCLLFFLAGAVWLQSLHAILWVVCWLTPAWVLYVKIYEERELEIRFNGGYLEYKARTPFFL